MDRYEAIEVLRKYSPKDAELKEALETAVPELKESEDERIRKELIGFLQDEIDVINCRVLRDTDDISRQEWCKKALAWLEKQGQEKTTWVKEDEIGFIDAIWAIEQARTIAKDENDMGNLWYAEKWLRTLKDRVQPHPAWKPTEEQMEAIKHAAEQNRASEMGNILDNLLVEIKNM